MNTIEKSRPVIVKITPKWELIPNKYKELKFSKSQIILDICKRYIEIIAAVEDVPTVLIEQGELESEEIDNIAQYAEKLGIMLKKEERINEKSKVIKIMEILNNYSYAENNWAFIAKRVLKREINKATRDK